LPLFVCAVTILLIIEIRKIVSNLQVFTPQEYFSKTCNFLVFKFAILIYCLLLCYPNLNHNKMKGKRSSYENGNSEKSTKIIDSFKATAETLPLVELEFFQIKYGVSNKMLSELTGHSQAQISEFKSEKIPMPPRVQQHLKLLFHAFESEFHKKIS
jgi:hypothetical protein